MSPEDLNELRELVEFLRENDIAEFELERGEMKVGIKFAGARGGNVDLAALSQALAASRPAAPEPTHAAPQAHAAPQSSQLSESPAAGEEELHIVKSPIVGTFYESAAPGAPAFVSVGQTVESGQVLCIVEAMKLMNEIESDASGEIVQRFVNNNQPVEYGQRLYAIRPRS
jgi:acetyl-CoA carboxylase biotin carboxyl carrier protein